MLALHGECITERTKRGSMMRIEAEHPVQQIVAYCESRFCSCARRTRMAVETVSPCCWVKVMPLLSNSRPCEA